MRNPYLCLVIVTFLGLSALAGIAVIGVLAGSGREVPQSIVAVVGGGMGALGSFLVQPPKGSAGLGGAGEPLDPLLAARLEAMDRHARANEQHLVLLREAVARLGAAAQGPAP